MLYSLFIKLGMFAVTLGVVFWIGWTLPVSSDRSYDLGAQSFEGSEVEAGSSPVSFVPNQSSAAPVPKRSHADRLDLNRATEQEFDALPGIGPRLAERIVEYRQSVGAFHSLDELREVKGIGKKKFERIHPLITIVPDGGSLGRGKKGT